MHKNDIDLLIYASLDKRVIEPAFSFFIAGALGLHRAQCFDVTEACNGWTRAVNIANSYIKSGEVNTAMIVSGEFFIHENEWVFNNFTINDVTDLDWAFSAYTLGECVNTTILSKDETNNWKFSMRGLSEFADLCYIPTQDYAKQETIMNQLSFHGFRGNGFYSYPRKLSKAGSTPLLELMQEMHNDLAGAQVVFPHTQSKKFWVEMEKKLHLPFQIPYYFSYPKYGNTITASIPASMELAEKEGILKRGDKVFCIMGAGGISCAAYAFNY